MSQDLKEEGNSGLRGNKTRWNLYILLPAYKADVYGMSPPTVVMRGGMTNCFGIARCEVALCTTVQIKYEKKWQVDIIIEWIHRAFL